MPPELTQGSLCLFCLLCEIQREAGQLENNIIIEITIHVFHTNVYPASILSRVDFPAPDGPRIQVSSPDRNSPETLCKIRRSPVDNICNIKHIDDQFDY